MNEEPEKLDLTSLDMAEERRQELLRLFPEIRTEGGKLDFERLKLALGEAVDVGRERYGMSWPGKAECFRTIQAPSLATLRPCPEESVTFDTTENLIIEGDNLEVLKLLQKSYLGKVKMIYIDPPYNTGNDFIYPDNYTESLQTYLEYTGQVDTEGKKFGTNTEADGRFHSKWLNMMYPRLYLARNLLAENGLIFVSIDDTEQTGLRHLLNDVFGESCFVAQLVWKKKTGAGAKSKGFIGVHEYILCYAKSISPSWDIVAPMSEKTKAMYDKRDEHFDRLGPFATWPLDTTSMDERVNLRYPILHAGQEIWPKKQWLWSRERVEKAQAENRLVFNRNEKEGTWTVRFKGYLYDDDGVEKSGKPTSLFTGPYTQEGTKDFQKLFDRDVFPFPKPVGLLKQLISIDVEGVESRDQNIVLDFFAGSGTTAEAALDLNQEDGGNRRFILVQLPEPTGRADYPTIAEICKERIRRVIKTLDDEDSEKLDLSDGKKQDRGFRVFKLAESSFRPWDASAPTDVGELTKQLEMFIDHIRDGRTDQDLLFEILLNSGYPLTSPVETLPLAGKTVHSVAGGLLFVCLERELTLELIRAMAERKPERVVCLDEGFAGNDQLKANAVQIFRTKGVTSFKTV